MSWVVIFFSANFTLLPSIPPPSPSIQTDLKKERCSISFPCIVSVYLKKKKEEEENSMLYELSCHFFFNQLYSTPFYSPSFSLNPNRF